MNRELKFRAWVEADHESGACIDLMCYYQKLECDNGLWFNTPDNIYHINEYYSIMQFTGMTDKDGKEIYESDIVGIKLIDSVEPKGYCICKCEVKFFKGCWCLFQIGFDYSNSPFEDITILHREENEIEVLGNIYENKNLLTRSIEQ